MLNIIILYKNFNTNDDIINYLTHINNINTNVNLKILITIINTNHKNLLNKTTLNNYDNIKNKLNNININFYNYKCLYNDSLYNEVIKLSPYNLLLFTNLKIYLSEPILEYILLNNIKKNCFIRTSILELNNIPNVFNENYNNNEFFNSIPDILEYVNNQNFKYKLTKHDYINNINNNNNTITYISNENIKKNKLYYLNNVNEFLLIEKDIVLKYGFNIDNKDSNYTFQYFILNLINNNISMTILPIILASYKYIDNNIIELLDENLKINCSTLFNENINYKHYDYNSNNEKSIIRSHIKVLNGINNNDLRNVNKDLNADIEELKIYNKNLNTKYKLLENELNETKNIVDEKNNINNILNEKNKELESTLEFIKNEYKILKNKYLDKLKIINSNINNLVCNEINNF